MQYYFVVNCIGYLFMFKNIFLIDANAKMWTEITELVVLERNYWSSCRVFTIEFSLSSRDLVSSIAPWVWKTIVSVSVSIWNVVSYKLLILMAPVLLTLTIEFLVFNTNLPIMAMSASKDFAAATDVASNEGLT